MNTNKPEGTTALIFLSLSSISFESCSQLAKGWLRREGDSDEGDPSLSCSYPWSFLFTDCRMTDIRTSWEESNPGMDLRSTIPSPMSCTSRVEKRVLRTEMLTCRAWLLITAELEEHKISTKPIRQILQPRWIVSDRTHQIIHTHVLHLR